MEAWLWRQTRPPTMPEVRHEEDHVVPRHPNHPPIPRPYLKCSKSGPDGRAWVPWCAMQVSYLAVGIVGVVTLRCRAHNVLDHLLRYSILDVSSVYRNGIEKRYSIEVPMAPRTYRACIESVSNKKCLDTVSRERYRKSRYTYDTLRYSSIQFDTFIGKMHPDT